MTEVNEDINKEEKQFCLRSVIQFCLLYFRRVIPDIFCFIWMGTCITSVILAINALQSMTFVLPLSDFKIPEDANIQLGTVKFQVVINAIIDTLNLYGSDLQNSITTSAKTSLNINIITAMLSAAGYFAQRASVLRKDVQNKQNNYLINQQ